MSQHTPGPWVVDHAMAAGLGKPVLCEWFVRRDGENVAIAADVIDPVTGLPSEANARLIAAAPKLLEACRALVLYDESDDADGLVFMRRYDDAVEKARAAIAKATGGNHE
jgi:hypothetical protein